MRRVNTCLFVIGMFSFAMIFSSIMTYTSEQKSYGQSSNFTKFTSMDLETAKEAAKQAKLREFVLEIQGVSTSNPKVTQFQLSGDNNQICKSGNCKYEFDTINISLPTVENTGLIVGINFHIDDQKSEIEKWRLYSSTGLSEINETDTNNLIYKFNEPLGFVRLDPPESEMPIDVSLENYKRIHWWNENTWHYDTGPVEYRSGEDRLIMTGTFNGHDFPTYDSDDIQVIKLFD